MNHNIFTTGSGGPPWQAISTVLLDMDGTLLDKYFDDYFWETYVPLKYAQQNNLSPDQAQTMLLAQYHRLKGTLHWSDLSYWSERLGLNLIALKKEIKHLIGLHPHVLEFLHFLRAKKKRICLITAAHPEALKLKMARVQLAPHFDQIICQNDLGSAKETWSFWEKLEQTLGFDKAHTLVADDTLTVLKTAHRFGIKFLLHIAKPSSKLPASYTDFCPSIDHFGALHTTRKTA